MVSRTPTRSTTPPAGRCRRSWTATTPRRTTAADLLRAPQQHLRAARQEPHDERLARRRRRVCPRDLCKDARLDEPFLDRLELDDRGPGPGLRPRGRPARDRGATCPRCPRTGATSAARAGAGRDAGASGGRRPSDARRQAERCANLDGNRRHASTSGSARSARTAADAELQARAAAPRSVAVPARRPASTAAGATTRSPDSRARATRTRARSSSSRCATCSSSASPTWRSSELIDHLEEDGIYDEALVVVTADHGVSFKQGQFDRRNVNARQHRRDLARCRCSSSARARSKGASTPRSSRPPTSLPTIADVLGIELPEKADGRSAFCAEVRKRDEVKMLKRDLSGLDPRRRRRVRRRKAEELIDRRCACSARAPTAPTGSTASAPTRS